MVFTITLSASVDTSIEAPGFPAGGVVSGKLLAREPSGKGVNLARYLKVMGVPVDAVILVGSRDADFYDSVLSEESIPHELLAIPGFTRNNITLFDPLSGLETHIRHPGLPAGEGHISRLKAVLRGRVSPGDWVAFSGGAPPGVDAKAFSDLLEVAKGLGAKLCVDTSGPYLDAALRLRPFLIKPNEEELSELLRRAIRSLEETASAARSLLDRVENVIVSCGAEGAVFASREGAWHCKVPLAPERVKGTVGCGDAVVAGFISASLDGLAPPRRLARAVACGSAAALWPCAGRMRREDIDELEERAAIRKL